jgi:hypothetical protein
MEGDVAFLLAPSEAMPRQSFEYQTVSDLVAVIKRLRDVIGAPLEVGKDPIAIFPPYEL